MKLWWKFGSFRISGTILCLIDLILSSDALKYLNQYFIFCLIFHSYRRLYFCSVVDLMAIFYSTIYEWCKAIANNSLLQGFAVKITSREWKSNK